MHAFVTKHISFNDTYTNIAAIHNSMNIYFFVKNLSNVSTFEAILFFDNPLLTALSLAG